MTYSYSLIKKTVMKVLEKIKLIPFTAIVTAMLTLSFQLVNIQALEWYEVEPPDSEGEQSIGSAINAPSGTCVQNLATITCAILLPNDHSFENLSEAPNDAPKAGRQLP